MNLPYEAGDAQLDLALKALKNNFSKQFVLMEKNLAEEELSALLLLVALSCLGSMPTNPLLAVPRANEYDKLSDGDWHRLGLELYSIVSKTCPSSAKHALPPPQLGSIKTARKLLPHKCFSSLGKDVSSIGFSYQILALGLRKEALRATQTANKELDTKQIIAFTQLYTPNWVVDFLVANTVAHFLKGKPTNRYSQWLVESGQRKSSSRQLPNIKIIDPACGSGQFLLSAFDLLFDQHRADGIDPAYAVQKILMDNLHGADIDPKAIWIATLGLTVKSMLVGQTIDRRLENLLCVPCQSDDLLGSISRHWLQQPNHVLGRSYDVVVTNPPYIGRKSLSRSLKLALRNDYPKCRADLCSAFLERSLEMLSPGGKMGIITQSSLLALPSYRALRQHLLTHYEFDAAITCGTGVFPLSNGEKIDNVLLIAQAPSVQSGKHRFDSANHAGVDLAEAATFSTQLSKGKDKAEQLRIALASFVQNGKDRVEGVRNKNRASEAKPNIRFLNLAAAHPSLHSIAEVRQGLATTNNRRFVRQHWDVPQEDIGPVWVPYVKGAGSERWYSESNFVVKWGHDGAEIKQAVVDAYPYLKGKSNWVVKNEQFYFRSGLCFSFINKNHLAVRRLPEGCIFDVASSAIFADNGNEDFLLAYLNSSLLSAIANAINPTINLQVGDIKRLPVLDLSAKTKAELGELARVCYENKVLLAAVASDPLSFCRTRDKVFFDGNGNGVTAVLGRIQQSQKELASKLETAEAHIDELVISSFNDLGQLSTNQLNLLAMQKSERICLTERRILASNVLCEAAARLMAYGTNEQVAVLPPMPGEMILQELGIGKESLAPFEAELETSICKYFQKPGVIDLSKQAKKASRYFSVWLPESKGLMFLSARAVRNGKSISYHNGTRYKGYGSDLPAYTQALSEAEQLLVRTRAILKNKLDWSSADLQTAISQLLEQA